jgi:hypothetical protein
MNLIWSFPKRLRDSALGRSVGRGAIHELINQVEPRVHRMREQQFPQAPTLVQGDGIWVTLQRQQEASKPDARHRNRHGRRGKQVVILVALGFWPDGRREIVAWQWANSEEQTQWEQLVKRLQARGVPAEQGLKRMVRDGSGGLGKALAKVHGKSILDQRCLVHKLDNVADNVCRQLKGQEQTEARKQMMAQAALMAQASQAQIAGHPLSDWAEQWRA